MTFTVLPAIDVSGGRLVRITADGPVPAQAFGGDPLVAAEAFVSAGARWLHVVDVDLAFMGEARNLGTIASIAASGALVQASGGLAAMADVDSMLEAGATRAVLGSAALADPVLVEGLADRFGPAIAVGIEVDGGLIRSRGRSEVQLSLSETLRWLAETDVERYVVTAVSRVGELSGPDLDVLRAVASATGRPIVAAAGIASLEDLAAVAAVESVEGAVVGRAFLGGGLDPSEVLTRFS